MTNNILTPADIFEHLTKKYGDVFPVQISQPTLFKHTIAYGKAGSLEFVKEAYERTEALFHAGNVHGKFFSGQTPKTHLGLSYHTGENRSGLAVCNLERLKLYAKTNPIAEKLIAPDRQMKSNSVQDNSTLIADLFGIPIGFIDEFVMGHYR